MTLDVDLPAGGGMVKVKPKIGSVFGGYALILELGDRGRAFGATCVRVPAPEPGRERLPTYAMDLGWPFEMSPKVFNVFKRLGVKGARVEGGYNTIADAHVDWAMENDLTLMLTVGCGGTPQEQQPAGRGRPWLRARRHDDRRHQGRPGMAAFLRPGVPAVRQEGRQRHTAGRRGRSTPWNCGTSPGRASRFRAGAPIFRVSARSTRRWPRRSSRPARRPACKVLIGGACSSTNTRDKLFCDGTDTFLPWLDFVSIHYQPLANDAALEPKWMNRKGEYGRVQVWDTESWVANSDDRVAGVIASMRAMGQDRTAGIYAGNVFTSEKPRVGDKEYAVAQVWAPGAAIAATQHFLGQRAFKEILFKNGLPLVFVFDGLAKKIGGERTGPVNPDDGTLVVLGDLSASYDRNRVLFRSVGLAKDARMELDDGGGKFVLYDFYANPLPSNGGKITCR